MAEFKIDPECEVNDCSRSVLARGWCSMHYERWRKYGDPLTVYPRGWRGTLAERFWARVAVGSHDECWLWQGPLLASGYGAIGTGTGSEIQSTHRVSYELTYGPISAGLFVLHRCDVRACVNPAHLFLGTAQDNVSDMIAKGRAAWQRETDYAF